MTILNTGYYGEKRLFGNTGKLDLRMGILRVRTEKDRHWNRNLKRELQPWDNLLKLEHER